MMLFSPLRHKNVVEVDFCEYLGSEQTGIEGVCDYIFTIPALDNRKISICLAEKCFYRALNSARVVAKNLVDFQEKINSVGGQ